MGKTERQRRAAAERRRAERRRAERARAEYGERSPGDWAGSHGAGAPLAGTSHSDVVAGVYRAAFQAWSAEDGAAFERCVQLLIGRPDVEGWRRGAEQALHGYLIKAVAVAWERGWQPADVARFGTRRLRGPGLQLLGAAIASELEQYARATVDPRWMGQLETIDARVWWGPGRTFLRAAIQDWPGGEWTTVIPHALELLCLLSSLPTLEKLGAVPGEYRGPAAGSDGSQAAPDVDPKVLARIRALLAKAEATTSDAEAEAFTAGAQERMARYSINQAMLEATDPGRSVRPAGRRIGIDSPYEASKAVLLDKVAQANRCQSVWFKELGFCTVVGFEADLAAVEALFTSLLVQAVTAMNRAGQRTGPGARSRTRAFRQSFLVAYAARIGERLAEITTEQAGAASAEPGGGNVLPVLASRTLAVNQAVAEMFPVLKQHSAGSVTDAEGWYSGRGAADLATLQSAAAVRD